MCLSVMIRVVHGKFSRKSGKFSEQIFHCVEKWKIIKAILAIFSKLYPFFSKFRHFIKKKILNEMFSGKANKPSYDYDAAKKWQKWERERSKELLN